MTTRRHPAHQATHPVPAVWQQIQLRQRLASGAPPLAFSCASIPACLGTLLLCLLNGLLIAIVGWMLLFAFFGRPVSCIALLCGWMPLWLLWNEGYWFVA